VSSQSFLVMSKCQNNRRKAEALTDLTAHVYTQLWNVLLY